MGTYNYDADMLIEELKDFLDNLAGDFNRRDLKEALEFMKDYAPTSDSSASYENRWHRLLKWRKKIQDKSISSLGKNE